MALRLPVETILDTPPQRAGTIIGRSRQGRAVRASRVGSGPLSVSLIAGCHADEPVGPAMLDRLVGFLTRLDASQPLLAGITWSLVPHANPDGDRANAAWSGRTIAAVDHGGRADRAFDLVSYARHVVREAPGDDLEFGFPRHPGDSGARPESREIAAFLAAGAPYHLHGSLHGMAFAPGPWFLIERAWVERSAGLRSRLRHEVRRMGYRTLDWDRRGDKGFERVDEGFSTRPDSAAMRRHFLERGDRATADLFRPSSMELACSLGGDPFTFVSEMPLFLHPDPAILAGGRDTFRRWLAELTDCASAAAARAMIDAEGIRPMPIRDQMRLQLAFVQEAIDLVQGARPQ
jgi:hypothetical protein